MTANCGRAVRTSESERVVGSACCATRNWFSANSNWFNASQFSQQFPQPFVLTPLWLTTCWAMPIKQFDELETSNDTHETHWVASWRRNLLRKLNERQLSNINALIKSRRRFSMDKILISKSFRWYELIKCSCKNKFYYSPRSMFRVWKWI